MRQINGKIEELVAEVRKTSDFLDKKYELAAFLMVGKQGVTRLFGKRFEVINR